MIAKTVRTCFPVAAQAVADKAEDINKLNVFPVPDGDTGTNMSLTLASVVRELNQLPTDADMEAIAGAITHGSLMGARGNSGVITSQILRGVAEGLVDAHDPVNSSDIAAAFRRAVKVAFQAVRKPVEGTILTVLRDVSTKADECEKKRLSAADALDAIVVEAYQSVARTPDLLPVLKENGVVDSGAFGFAIFLESFVAAALGRTAKADIQTTFDAVNASDAKATAMGRVEIEANDDWEGSEFRYCNEFLFKADKKFNEEKTLKFLASMGDCELLVGSFPDYKVHVHSNTPDKVLKHFLALGQIFEVFIHNMDLEAAERTAKIHADQDAAAPEPTKPLGFVAVAAGSGEADILKSLGVDVVVSGGQTMNPSTADLLDAVAKVNADAVIILPDNGNIRMAAEAAASACEDKQVAVVPTKTVPQAFSALFNVEPGSSLEDAVEVMTEALADVRDGEVTRAVRDSAASDGAPIHAGDVMGIIGGSIDIVGSSVKQVTVDCINRMQEEEEGDTLTILAGEELDDAAFQEILDAIEEAQPDLEIDSHRGEQPLYPVIFSIE
ncbi:Dihydroxyacetone kinase family protein [Collinsella sp. AK_207A]|uniref:DAK2 domain-containing protein n=1 Tax=Collinsella sp. AK_207A TaxID=2650472 RepID=UPI001261022A|nr:DAK2 domain-containing protein [Collinsella sp. AK_207A]VWM05627.1 Dihydroxyacetone kinase family protein [Collinsella sp. AK_207A]